jgi:predicted nucleic acid-binding protein
MKPMSGIDTVSGRVGLWTIDTNVLIYALEKTDKTHAGPVALKQAQARKLLAGLSACETPLYVGQVITECLNVLLLKRTLSNAQAFEVVHLFAQNGTVLPASASAYAQAWLLVRDHRYQVWDALIIAVSAEHGIKTLYSEDAGSLQRPLGVQVINPFAELEKA